MVEGITATLPVENNCHFRQQSYLTSLLGDSDSQDQGSRNPIGPSGVSSYWPVSKGLSKLYVNRAIDNSDKGHINASVANAEKKKFKWQIEILAKICLTAKTVGGSQFCLQMEL